MPDTPSQQNNNQIPQNPTIKTPKLHSKTLQAIQLVNAGITAEEALKMVNLKRTITPAATSRFKNKYKKYSLTAPPMVKLAHNQIKRILAAEEREVPQQKVLSNGQVVDYKEVIVPTDSNILAAAGMVYERYEPVQSPDGGEPGGVTYLDLSQYRVQVNVVTPELSTGSNTVVIKGKSEI